jgi:hypothetical protein
VAGRTARSGDELVLGANGRLPASSEPLGDLEHWPTWLAVVSVLAWVGVALLAMPSKYRRANAATAD